MSTSARVGGRRDRTTARSLVVGALLASLTGCSEPGVVRVVDGRPEVGRAIDEQAYALYAAGAEQEARGDDDGALRFFKAALAYDAESAEIRTRIGALLCRRPNGLEAARAAFGTARARSPEDASPLLAEARCALDRGDVAGALTLSARAVTLAPRDEAASLLAVEALTRADKTEEARRRAAELVLLHPRSREAWRALYGAAKATHDAPLLAGVPRRARERSVAAEAALDATGERLPLAEVDAALVRDDLERALHHALRARITPGEVALRAAGLGRLAAAQREAELVLHAAPDDTSARIARAVAADLGGDTATLAATIAQLAATPAPAPTRLGRLLFAELLHRRVDREAALAWLGSAERDGASDDPLVDAVAQRAFAALSPEATR